MVSHHSDNARELMALAQQRLTYRNFHERESNPYAVISHTPCFSPHIDRLLKESVDAVTSLVTRPNPYHSDQSHPSVREEGVLAKAENPPSDPYEHVFKLIKSDEDEVGVLTAAAEKLVAGIKLHPNCPIIVLNWVAIMFRLGQDREALSAALQALDLYPRHPALSVYAGLLSEIYLNDHVSARRNYSAAIGENSDLALDLFGVHVEVALNASHRLLFFTDGFDPADTKSQIQLWALRRLMLAREFAPDFGTGPVLTREEARAWQRQWYFHVKGFLSPYTTTVLTRAYRALISGGHLTFKDPQAVRFVVYNDPVTRFMLATHRRIPSRITDFPTKPTYTYFGGYMGSAKSELKPHTDRAQCEFTASVSIDISPVSAECPLGLNPRPKGLKNLELSGASESEQIPDSAVYVKPRPGDALLFKGRHLVHWREPIPFGVNCSNIFLHFVHDAFTGRLG